MYSGGIQRHSRQNIHVRPKPGRTCHPTGARFPLSAARRGYWSACSCPSLSAGNASSLSIVALSIGDAEARAIATRVIEERVVRPLARWLGPPDAQARALEIVMLAMGFVQFTRPLPLISASRTQERKVATWLADALQRIVDRA